MFLKTERGFIFVTTLTFIFIVNLAALATLEHIGLLNFGQASEIKRQKGIYKLEQNLVEKEKAIIEAFSLGDEIEKILKQKNIANSQFEKTLQHPPSLWRGLRPHIQNKHGVRILPEYLGARALNIGASKQKPMSKAHKVLFFRLTISYKKDSYYLQSFIKVYPIETKLALEARGIEVVSGRIAWIDAYSS